MARCYPPGGIVISTGAWADSAASDAEIHQRVDRLPIHSNQLKSVPGLVRWSYRAEALARELSPEFTWCGNLKPAGYPARWVHARSGTPYGIIFHGTDLLKLERHVARSPIRRATARAVIGSAAVYVTNSRWTAGVCERVLEQLGFDPAERGPRARGPARDRSRALPARPRFARDSRPLRPRRGTLASHGHATGRAQRSGRRHQGHGAARRRLSGPGVHRGGRRRDQAVTRNPREIARRG